MTEIQDALIELQTRVAYQDDTIAQLNEVITRQDADIHQLQQQVRVLAKRLEEIVQAQELGPAEIVNERPPHY